VPAGVRKSWCHRLHSLAWGPPRPCPDFPNGPPGAQAKPTIRPYAQRCAAQARPDPASHVRPRVRLPARITSRQRAFGSLVPPSAQTLGRCSRLDQPEAALAASRQRRYSRSGTPSGRLRDAPLRPIGRRRATVLLAPRPGGSRDPQRSERAATRARLNCCFRPSSLLV
jgi:hypothetical protein